MHALSAEGMLMAEGGPEETQPAIHNLRPAEWYALKQHSAEFAALGWRIIAGVRTSVEPIQAIAAEEITTETIGEILKAPEEPARCFVLALPQAEYARLVPEAKQRSILKFRRENIVGLFQNVVLVPPEKFEENPELSLLDIMMLKDVFRHPDLGEGNTIAEALGQSLAVRAERAAKKRAREVTFPPSDPLSSN